MRRRRFALALGTALSLAGCSSDTPGGGSEPTATPPSETTTESPRDPPETELLPYLFTADEFDGDWSRTAQMTDRQPTRNFAERVFQHADTARELFVGLRAQDSVAVAEQAVSSARSQFEGGESLGETVGDETYASYPEAFETGVLFRAGRYVGLVALAGNDPTREEAVARAEALHANLPDAP